MRALRSVTLIAGAALLNAAAAFQGDDQRLTGRLDERTRDAVLAVVEGARKEGLPSEPLIDKALEGASKRAPGSTIVAVVRGMVADLRRAREALGAGSNLRDIEAGASALRAGVPLKELQRIRTAPSPVHVAHALDVISVLVNDGVHVDSIAPRVVTLVLAGATNDQLTALRQDIKLDISGGVLAATAASLRGDGLARQLAAQATNVSNSGAPGTPLPSVRGQSRVADPLANPQAVGQVQGNANVSGAGDGARPVSPRGKPKPKRP